MVAWQLPGAVQKAAPMANPDFPYTIEPAELAHTAPLPGIELAASVLFPDEDLPPSHRVEETPISVFERAVREHRLWVALEAAGAPIGFALVDLVDATAHLHELHVLPSHGRRGVGTALVRTVMGWAEREGFPALTLITFRHLAWNMPFYQRLGFEPLDESELTPELRGHLAREAREGLDLAKRVVMRRAVAPRAE
jgi:GNAT superfamily N-acetyltransferase